MVERHVANVNVASSTLVTRLEETPLTDRSAAFLFYLHAHFLQFRRHRATGNGLTAPLNVVRLAKAVYVAMSGGTINGY